jgi:hypothetical protein
MYIIDFGTHNEGHARLKLYDVKKHGGKRRARLITAYNDGTLTGEWQESACRCRSP